MFSPGLQENKEQILPGGFWFKLDLPKYHDSTFHSCHALKTGFLLTYKLGPKKYRPSSITGKITLVNFKNSGPQR